MSRRPPPRITVTNLRVEIDSRPLVRSATFTIAAGERACLVGASGSGKSLTAGAILGQLPSGAVATGSIRINGIEVLQVPPSRRPATARASAVFQDSSVALNPAVRLRDQLIAPLRRHRNLSRTDAARAAVDLAASVGLPDPARLLSRYSGELSGGQRQRVCIAMAVACDTGLLVADEPTSALDVVTQRRVLGVLERYVSGPGAPALLFITHDHAAAREFCRRAIVMHDGVAREQTDAALPSPRPLAVQRTSLSHASNLAPNDQRRAGFALDTVSRSYPLPRPHPFAPQTRETALAPTTLTIRAGERVGIVGESGAGKTTLLRLMLALEWADGGRLTFDGRALAPGGPRALGWYRRRVQYVPQDPASTLHPRMNVRRLLHEPLRRLRIAGDHDAMISAALQAVDLDAALQERRAAQLSGGQAQRVALARAIVAEPEFLLADEPVSGLDPHLRTQTIALLRRVCVDHGMGLVVVSHDLSVVAELCERTLVIHDGRVVEDRPAAALLSAPQHPHTRDLIDAARTIDAEWAT